MSGRETEKSRPDTGDVPTYDERAWPIFVSTLPRRPLSSEEFRAHVEHVEKLYERGQPFALIFDVRDAAPLNAVERKLIADRSAKMAAKYPGLLRGMVIVLSSPIARGIYTAITWMTPPPQPTIALSGLSEAFDWLNRNVRFT